MAVPGSGLEEPLVDDDGLENGYAAAGEGNGEKLALVRDGSVDLKGRPASKAHTGGWKSCAFIFGNDVVERIVYHGVSANLISYLVGVLHQDRVSSVKSVNNWSGTICITPFVGAFVADAYFGLYWTIAVTSFFYLTGLVMLTLSASLPGLRPSDCAESTNLQCSPATPAQLRFFYVSLYVLCVGAGGIKSCASAFGAAQFDSDCRVEKVKKSSFFNWWFLGIKLGMLFSVTVVVYVQDNVGWGWGFGIPTALMLLVSLLFFAGSPFYRHQKPTGSPLTSYCQVVVAALRNRGLRVPSDPDQLNTTTGPGAGEDGGGKVVAQLPHTSRFRCLDKAATPDPAASPDHASNWKLCTVTQVEQVKIFAGMFPIWFCSLFFNLVTSQVQTFFVLQGRTLDGHITSWFDIPPASLQLFTTVPVLIGLPLYDWYLVPFLRRRTGTERGITMLQRIGLGMAIVLMVGVSAALTERRRLQVARAAGALDSPDAVLPMSIFWLVPQYVAMGVSDIFTGAGYMEFFYDQSPDNVKTIGSAIPVSAIGIGAYMSSALISVVKYVTGRGGGTPWLIDNINRSRLDNYYWLIVAICVANMVVYVATARSYTYTKSRRR